MPKTVDTIVKRSEFIAASVDVIALEGLSAASLRRIAQQAGCTTGSLTHYYSNRKSLLLDILRSVHRAAGERMVDLMAIQETNIARLEMVLLEALPLDNIRLKEWRVWLAFWGAAMDDKDLTDENRRRYREWHRLVETLLEPLVDKSELKAEAGCLISLIDGLGVGVARQHIGQKIRSRAQCDCRLVLRQYLLKFVGR